MIADLKSITRAIKKTKIDRRGLLRIDRYVQKNNDKSARTIKARLGIRASHRTLQKYIRFLGYRKVRTKFCQFVSRKNQIERVVFAKVCILTDESFHNCIFIDESTVKMQRNANRRWFRPDPNETRLGLVGQYKHVPSVHVIGGISRFGATTLITFEGKMDSQSFQDFLDEFLIPFINANCRDDHRLIMDNCPSHTSARTKQFIQASNIRHYQTPAQSPDLNPIELVWHDMKDFIARLY
jgi:hypothetical protein